MHFVLVGALPRSLVNFRGDLIRSAVASGHRVTAMSARATSEEIAAVRALGADFRAFDVDRTGLDPVSDARCLLSLRRAFAELDPDVILAYTIKPVIWGGLALATLRTRARFFALITGLGYAFEGRGPARRTLSALVAGLYRLALSRAQSVVFQNADNRDAFVGRGIVPVEKCRLVGGSGVDTDRFGEEPLPENDGCRFLLIARLLAAKGLREYAAAAAEVRKRHPDATFHLVGPADTSPDAISLSEVEAWHRHGAIIYHGASSDVRTHIAASHVYVLPSYHEGMPRSVLEAMSMGRPVLTTDVPGCRETVVAGDNGWLVPKANWEALAERMNWFIENPGKWADMGARSRQLAVERFDVHSVNRTMLAIMGLAEPVTP